MIKPNFLFAAGLLCLSACTTTESSMEAPQMATEPQPTPLSLERLFASPSLSGASPRGVKFSPDGQRVTFLKPRADEAARLDLWQFDVATGEQSLLVDSTLLEPEEVALSEEEKALRERRRIAGARGIVSYDWGTSDTILVPLGGDLYLVTLAEEAPTVRQLTDTDAFEYDAKVAPNGQAVSFVRDGAVYVIDLVSGAERQITPSADPDAAVAYGVAEFVAQEEMSRYTGYWWSADSRYVAYTRVDESTVDIIPRFDIAADEVTVIEQRYPRSGRPNAVVDMFIVDLETDTVQSVDWRQPDWGPATDQYLARVNWTGGQLHLQAVNRDQTEIAHLAIAVPESAEVPLVPARILTETQENWVNLAGYMRYLSRAGVSIMTSEASGFRHIHVKPDAGDWTALTSGDWIVESYLGTDADTGMVYFTGYKDTVLERHLYQVPLAGGDVARLTPQGQTWSVTLSPDAKSYVATSSSPTQPPQTGLYSLSGDRIAWIEENALDSRHPYAPYLDQHTVPTYGTLMAEDGQTLHYSIQTPPDFDPTQQYPAIVAVYGGPGVQTVDRDWERLDDQFYSREGYIVFRLDNRGSAKRGKVFEDVIYRLTGGPEVRDQLVGVDWLKSQPFVDADRVAIQGWSYGGYMTLMTILQAPEGTFAAAVSGAPVTDWRLYDTFYTERYMDTPEDNLEGYDASSVFAHLDGFSTPLLLIHGMADDNVTFDNSTRLMAALQEAGETFELMTYPGQRHGIRGEALRTHLMRTRMAFLDRHLKGDSE